MQDFKIQRTGAAPLKFTGEIIGCATRKTSLDSTSAVIYRTAGGKYVGQLELETCWCSQHGNRNYVSARALDTAEDVVKFFDEDGRLNIVGQDALEQAAEKCEEFALAYVELVP